MSLIKNNFSISDLENLSGIKAHTIRIWEKRYGLLAPERTDTNIRYYSIDSLRKLLNVVLLKDHGIKISKIAQMGAATFNTQLKELVNQPGTGNQTLNEMQVAMFNFDRAYFSQLYDQLAKELPFDAIFEQYFIPLLAKIGLLWQSNVITPAHEHFISQQIKEKLIFNIGTTPSVVSQEKDPRVFVLFLPEGEMHDVGLYYVYYQLLKKGKTALILGPSVPIESLCQFVKESYSAIYLSVFTVAPSTHQLQEYLEEFHQKLLCDTHNELWAYGKQIQGVEAPLSKVHFFDSYSAILESL